MSNILISPEHQSAPKQTELNRAIRTAALEIHDGTFTPELKDNLFGKPEDDFFQTGITGLLAQHPRVQDAIRLLQTQASDKTNPEYVEKAEQLHELNAAAAAADQWHGQERWQGKNNREMRLVNLMQPFEFIRKLQDAHIVAMTEPRIEMDYKADHEGTIRLCETEHSDAKVCLGRRVVRGCVGVFANVRGEYRYINKLQVPIGPEWTVMRFDEYGIPTNEEYHGWRSAVLGLITQRVITEKQADRAFGKAVENAASSFYREQLAEWRNSRAR